MTRKDFVSRGLGPCAAALVLAALAGGCESVKPEGFSWEGTGFTFDNNRLLKEPERAGVYEQLSFPALRRIEEVPVEFVFEGEVEKVLLTKRMLWGTTENVATVDVKDVIKRQFLQAVSGHFHPLVGDQQPAVRIKVETLGVFLERRESVVLSEMTMRFELQDVAKNVVCHEKVYSGEVEVPWDGGALVPEAFYKCIQKLAANFLRDIAGNRTLIARLEGISLDPAAVRKPSFKACDIKPKNADGVVRGNCVVACNDWDEGRVANWIRSQLEQRCENQLGVDESSKVRLVYDSSSFDGATREWKVDFTAFARSEMVLNYDSVTMSGTCVADFGLMKMTPEKAADVLKEYVMQEMDKRAGAQPTGKDGPKTDKGDSKADKGDSKAQVRFYDFKTDQRYALTYCAFRLVY